MQTEVLLKHLTYSYKVIQNKHHEILGIAYNSNKCKPGFVFVAIVGEKFDGHNYIKNAVENGANTVICQTIPKDYKILKKITFILVENTRIALAETSRAFYDYPDNKLKVIGITGTNGKTTVTFLLKSVFEVANKKVGIIGTTGIFIGNKKIEATHTTPESLELHQLFVQMLEEGIEYVVVEISSHSIAMHRVHGINFVATAFTNLTTEHMDFHTTMQNYADTKKRIFDHLQENAVAIINGDDKYASYMVENCRSQILEISRQERPDTIHLTSEELDKSSSKFVLDWGFGKEKILFKIKLPALFNIENAAIVAVIANSLELETTAIKIGLLNSTGAPGRLERVQVRTGAIAYVDYAHTPDALEKALTACKQMIDNENTGGKLISVFGCGGDRDKTKRPIMGEISSRIANITILTDDNPRTESSTDIINDILQGIDRKKNPVISIPDRELAIKKAIELSTPLDVILIAGKGHEYYQVLGTSKIKFNDVEELLKA